MMSMSNVGATCWAVGILDTNNDAGVNPSIVNARGISGVVRVDANTYDLTLVNQLAANQCVASVFCMKSDESVKVTLTHVSAQVKRIKAVDLLNNPFSFGLFSVTLFQLI